MSAPIRIEMSLLTMSSGIWLRWGYLLCISCFNIFCGGKFNLWTTHALRTYRCPGYCLEEIDKVTNFDLTVANFDIAFDLFNRFISLFSWSWCAKLEVIKVASEPESRSASTANVLEPWLIFTEITWRNLILPTFCICWLKVLLVLACSCMSFWCNEYAVSYHKGWLYISISIYNLLFQMSLKKSFYIVFALLQTLFFRLLTSF